MARKQYKFANNLRNTSVVIILSYAVFQGILYMTPGERAFKIFLSLFLSFPLILIGLPIPLGLISGHLINFCLNSQIPVMLRYVVKDPGLKKESVVLTINMLEKTASRYGITEVLFYGSFCRHQLKSTSDLDIRLHHLPGLAPALKAYVYAFKIRLWANLNLIPIDVYCFSDPSFLSKMNISEYPSLLFFSETMTTLFPRAEGVWVTLEKNVNIL